MPEPTRAVFLSYASADAEAARRICEALRTAGVEVWFDVDGGLETGDEWDAKIRRQIKECVLFLPLVSANTQAREEGYFRIEWDLAAERARGFASGVAFILPIVLDDTREPEALVPDRFRSVQWTRARAGELPPETRTRLARLWSHRVGLAAQQSRPPAQALAEATPLEPAPELPRTRGPRRWGIAIGATALAATVAAFVLTRKGTLLSPTADPGSPTVVSAASAPGTDPAAGPRQHSAAASAPAATRDWPRRPELKRATTLLDGLNAIPEDFRLAEEIARQAVEKEPTDPECLTVMARVHSQWLLRGWDRSQERFQKAKAAAERALQLSPDEPEAHLALAIYLFTRGVERSRALDLAQRAVDLWPDEPRFHRIRNNCLFTLNLPGGPVGTELTPLDQNPGVRQAIEAAEQAVQRFPRDPLVRYDLSRLYRDVGRWADFERVNEEVLTLAPVANALVWRARARFGLHGDLPGMKAALDQVPARVRGIERTVYSYFIYAAFSGRTEEGLAALDSITEPWMADFDYRGPKALLAGTLLERAGKKELARLQFELALDQIRRARTESGNDVATYLIEAWTLWGLGRMDEARTALRVYNESLARPWVIAPVTTWWFGPTAANLLFGERDTALALIREATATRPEGRATLRSRLGIDPRMAAFREDPVIQALLAEPSASPAASAAASPPPAAAPLSEAAQLAARAKSLYTRFAYTRQDLATAEELARRATQLDPGLADAWGALAGAGGTMIQRSWDVSEARLMATQEAASKALGLAPEHPEALWSLGYVLGRQGSTEQAAELFRRAYAAAPDDNRMPRAYAGALVQLGDNDEEKIVLEAALKRFPDDPLIHYNLAQNEVSPVRGIDDPARVKRALAHLDAGFAAQPLGNILIYKALVTVGATGDLKAARKIFTEMDKLPLAERTEDRAVFVALWLATLERDVSRANAAAALTARNYFEDRIVHRRPKAWSLALARQAAGKENLARLEWQRAESLLRDRLRSAPNDVLLTSELAMTLAWLGRGDEADALMKPLEAAWREEPTLSRSRALADYAAARGDGAKAGLHLRDCLGKVLLLSTPLFRLDPWFDKVRDHPDVQRALAEAESRIKP
jgi:tetratricopeptide (TPR) repeat protein